MFLHVYIQLYTLLMFSVVAVIILNRLAGLG
jgi:hypothetical protein